MEGREEDEVAAVVEKHASLSLILPPPKSWPVPFPKSFSPPSCFFSSDRGVAETLAAFLCFLLLLLLLLPRKRRAPLGEEKNKRLLTWFSLSLPEQSNVSLSICSGMFIFR